MLRVHTNDGATHVVDLSGESSLCAKLSDPEFQKRITALTIAHAGVQYSIPKSQHFADFTLTAEPVKIGRGGERIVCSVGEIKITLTVYYGQRAARISITPRWRTVWRNKGYGTRI